MNIKQLIADKRLQIGLDALSFATQMETYVKAIQALDSVEDGYQYAMETIVTEMGEIIISLFNQHLDTLDELKQLQ